MFIFVRATEDFGEDCTYEKKDFRLVKTSVNANTSNDTPKEPDRCIRGLEVIAVMEKSYVMDINTIIQSTTSAQIKYII